MTQSKIEARKKSSSLFITIIILSVTVVALLLIGVNQILELSTVSSFDLHIKNNKNSYNSRIFFGEKHRRSRIPEQHNHHQVVSSSSSSLFSNSKKEASSSSWMSTFSRGLNKWASIPSTTISVSYGDSNNSNNNAVAVDVEIVALKHPVLILSGATPGPFYHSHPHISKEFDHLDFSMDEQVRSNIATILKIAETVQDYNIDGLLPFKLPLPSQEKEGNNNNNKYFKGIESPQFVNWISNNKESKDFPLDYNSRLEVVNKVISESCCCDKDNHYNIMDSYEILNNYETGDNVSDRRFRLETFAMFGIEEGTTCDDDEHSHTFIQLDMKDIFDPQYFMPYVPAYAVSGGNVAIFTITAASCSNSAAWSVDDHDQVKVAYENMILVLKELGATFDDVIMIWNRVEDLNKNERSVLMTRSEIMGLNRPLAESVLEVNGKNDTNNIDERTGNPLWIELIVAAQIPTTKK
jgi:enamine deaminase RidA (YjgF/YER057c/UK114 family)